MAEEKAKEKEKERTREKEKARMPEKGSQQMAAPHKEPLLLQQNRLLRPKPLRVLQLLHSLQRMPPG